MVSRRAEKIRAARLAAGLTQKQLAEAVGVTARTVCRWERGDVAPRNAALFKVARRLGLPAEELE